MALLLLHHNDVTPDEVFCLQVIGMEGGPPAQEPTESEESEVYVCPICQSVAKQQHQTHYGGMACFSCRAFFRRAHQTSKTPNFVCNRNNSCVINVKTRRSCQKCRYLICLRVGMDPELVLTEDQRKSRFRNALLKKAFNANAATEQVNGGSDADQISLEQRESEENREPNDNQIVIQDQDEPDEGPDVKKPKLDDQENSEVSCQVQ